MSNENRGPDRSAAVPLDLILTPELAAVVVYRIADTLAEQDMLPERVAFRMACERATDGDPLVLAAPGQVWELREWADPDMAPCGRLQILQRLFGPPRVLAADADDLNGEGQMEELPIEVLEMFDLVSWDTAFLSPARAGGGR
ncbi:hypothetical protein [Streptacidiphilus sp. MAP5-52]|uniref:hypothetical protein n=1 Tax=Streptacidiphilus sp. MAP5-52 TaxID=3156267 RepID=UPI003516679A